MYILEYLILGKIFSQEPILAFIYPGVQSQVESYQRLKKWYLMPPCLTQHYKVGIKSKVE